MTDVTQAANNTLAVDLAEGPGGYYNPADRSGPYSVGSDGVAHLIGGGDRQQLGFEQVTNLSTPQPLTPPVGATVAVVTVEGSPVRWRADGVSPTATTGNLLPVGAIVTFSGGALAAEFLQVSGTAALGVNYEV